MALLDQLLRAYRRLARPLDRRLIHGRDRRRLARLLHGEATSDRLPVFVVVVPRTLGWLGPCLKLVPAEVTVYLLTNGLSRAERRRLAMEFPRRQQFALSVLPGSFAKHGTVLDLIVAAAPGDFVLLDHDCYVFDPALFAPVSWGDKEFLAAVDVPGFFTINAASGLKFPRTHFLIVRRERFVELGARFGIGCEKAQRTPRRMRQLLGTIGLGDHNFPPARMAFYDTLQLAMSAAFALGWATRRLAASVDDIAHIGGTARQLNQPGLAPRTADEL